MYKVNFADTELFLNKEEFQNFINIAVVNNKDINNFTVAYIGK